MVGEEDDRRRPRGACAEMLEVTTQEVCNDELEVEEEEAAAGA